MEHSTNPYFKTAQGYFSADDEDFDDVDDEPERDDEHGDDGFEDVD